MKSANKSLVSVIIPCYNQGRFLADAIESVLKQSYPRREIVVVDDGSTDDSSQVASEYPVVKLIRQQNCGLSAARNAGLDASAGDYLVFLDADDRLLPHALQAGSERLDAHSDCAFAYGRYSLTTDNGVPIDSYPAQHVQGEPYLRLLRSNYIGMHATVMYRRKIFDVVGRFDTSLAACEDYDLYLRITRNHAIYRHAETVAEYRQHDSNMSRNTELMLKHSLSVLGSQWKYVRENRHAREACRAGQEHWRDYYGNRLLTAVRARAGAGEWKRAVSGGLILLRYYPAGVAHKVSKRLIRMTAHAPRIFSIKTSR